MPVFPVTWMEESDMPSRSRFSLARGVGAKMKVGENRGHPSVHLLGKRMKFVSGAQSGLHMSNPYLQVMGRQRCCKRRCRIALDQDPIGMLLYQDGMEGFETSGSQVGQALSFPHHFQVVVRGYPKGGEDLIEHAAMLSGDANAGRKADGVRLQFLN